MMPTRFLTYSRTEPARTILFIVALLTFLMEALTLVPGFASFWLQLPNVLIVNSVCGWAIWATVKVRPKQMARSSFWLFMIWLWSGLSRLSLSPDPSMLLWAPMLVVAAALSVVYLYLSHEFKKAGTDEWNS